jgi:type VI secretion system protein ImpB
LEYNQPTEVLLPSLQKKISRVRSPRVHITTDVETGAAIEMLELPFVVGVLGDFSGQPAEPLAAVRDRKFTEINPDNFDAALKAMKPRLSLAIDNKLDRTTDTPGKLGIELKFESLEDFEPHRIAQQVPALQSLLELRTKLSDLKSSLEGNPKFEELLEATVRNTESRGQLAGEIQKTKDEKAKAAETQKPTDETKK